MQTYIIVRCTRQNLYVLFGRSRFFLTIFHASTTILLRLPAKSRTFDGLSRYTYCWFIVYLRKD